MKKLIFLLLLAASPLVAQNTNEATSAEDELAYITTLLSELQLKSFQRNKEYCGYVGYNRLGELRQTRISEGTEATCTLPSWPLKMTVIASFHTHSTYSEEFDSEFPTAQDMETDEEEGIDGYISTPGGRLWFIDTQDMIASQLCGIGCLPQDPNFIAAPEGSVRISYTYRALQKRESF